MLVLFYQRLELVGRECINPSALGDDEEKNLSARQRRQLVGLPGAMSVSGRPAGKYATQVTFFMIPAFRFEKVM